MSIQELLGAAEEPASIPPATGLAAVLAAAEAEPLQSMSIDIAVGDASAQIVITEIRGRDWTWLRDRCQPPRFGQMTDFEMGCNADAFLVGYPVDSIAIDGVNPTDAEWQRLCELMGATPCSDLVAALWWMHIGEPQQNLAAAMATTAGEPQ